MSDLDVTGPDLPAPVSTTESDIAARIGLRIKELRDKQGLSMRALAAVAGVSQPFLSQLERGQSAPSMVTTYRLASALGVSPGELLPVVAEEPADPVVLVPAGSGRLIPVSDRPDSAVGRALRFQDDSPLQVVEYVVGPGEHLTTWFEAVGETGVYVVSGRLAVEVDGGAVHRLGPRDFLAFPTGTRERWSVEGDEPVHLLLSVAMPSGD